MASSSNPSHASVTIQDLEYLHASNVNVSNLVSVKLSGYQNYHLWKKQMLCLMDIHNMRAIVDHTVDGPRASNMEITRKYDNLLKGWIFGSISENVLNTIIDIDSAKDIWQKLNSIYYVPTIDSQQETERGRDTISIDIEAKGQVDDQRIKKLHKVAVYGRSWDLESILRNDKDAAGEIISNDGNTMLHIAVRLGHHFFVKKLLEFIEDEKVLETRNSDGSTALHVAAIVGNTYAADLLVKKMKKLLEITDQKGLTPMDRALHNLHLDTFSYLLKANEDDDNSMQGPLPAEINIYINILVKAIYAKQYDLASKLLHRYPALAAQNDDVLLAIARKFPSQLDHVESLIYPSSYDFFDIFLDNKFVDFIEELPGWLPYPFGLLYIPIAFPIMMVYYSFTKLYFLLWNVASSLVAPIKHIEKKKMEYEEAKRILTLVCDQIDEKFPGTHPPFYTKPILEAACQNAYEVVEEILDRSPNSRLSRNENGHHIIQLAVIHRSEKVYNQIHRNEDAKIFYRTIKDSSNNNMLHLAGRMAPILKLNRRRGAALQLQNELQWHEEVKKLVFPTYISEENNFKETPEMVFTREHENLVKEGEKWMKTTAESYTIAVALITTIVFAAAITVPGGNNQDTGIPAFNNEIAFTIFAISDAISLSASATSLLVFLSILTARFSERDFLVSLPRRLIIGLCTLLVSVTAMMVAFGAIMFLVFCQQKAWMLFPICGLSGLPITFFVILQFPLIIDLFRSTYVPIFY